MKKKGNPPKGSMRDGKRDEKMPVPGGQRQAKKPKVMKGRKA